MNLHLLAEHSAITLTGILGLLGLLFGAVTTFVGVIFLIAERVTQSKQEMLGKERLQSPIIIGAGLAIAGISYAVVCNW